MQPFSTAMDDLLNQSNVYFLDASLLGLIPFFEQNNYSKVGILVDDNTYRHCYPLFNQLPPHHIIKIKPGEEQKNLKTAQKIWEQLTQFAFDRHSLLINIGGGVIGDMGGFCAATYKRGIDFIQVPTTLLAQVDASVGGKLGIDFMGYKNHIGVFTQPKSVFINPNFIKTLPENELLSGYAEIIKHALIYDKTMWEQLQNANKAPLTDKNFDWKSIIERSVRIKAQVVQADPTEKGLRKILNFGHTLGHAIETYFLEIPARKLLHGQAIAIGMVTESFLSYKLGHITKKELESITRYILSLYGKVAIQPEEFAPIIAHTYQDKKNSKGKINFSLLKSIGTCGYDIATTDAQMQEALAYYCNG